MKIKSDKLARLIGLGSQSPRTELVEGPVIVQRRNRAAAASVDLSSEIFGAGGRWAKPEYGAYYANSVSVYAAIKLRADAVSRPPVRIYRQEPRGNPAAGGAHPSGAATLGAGQPLVHPQRLVAGHRNLPEPVGPGFLGPGTGRGGTAGNLAACVPTG